MKKVKLFNLLLVFISSLFIFNKDVFAVSSRYYLDYPVINSLQGDSLYVQGWLMSDDSKAFVSIFIDGKEVDADISRYQRDDVIKAINGYGGILTNPMPGFKSNIDISSYSNGTHLLEIIIFSGSKVQLGKISSSFQINRNIAKMYLDYPVSSSLFDDVVIVDGWIMSPSNNGNFRVYIDNQIVDYLLLRSEREDVIKAINGYGDSKVNPKPGFSIKIDSSSILDGNHTIKIEYVNTNDVVIASLTKNVNIKKNIAKMYLDSPSSNISGDSIKVSGWVMSPYSNVKLLMYIDNQLVDGTFIREVREDVVNAISGYGDSKINSTPGFYQYLDMSSYKDGIHTLKIEAVNIEGNVLTSVERAIELKKYDSKMYLDNLTNNLLVEGDSLYFKGWLLTNIPNASIAIYIDNTLIDTVINRVEREDVLIAFGDIYGRDKQNAKPGFETTLDLSNYKDGEHQISVRVINSKTNEEVLVQNRIIKLDKYDSKISIDNLAVNQLIQGTSLYFKGWALTEAPNASVAIYIDNTLVDTVINRVEREDVLIAFGDVYGRDKQNAKPGFETTLDLSSYKDGEHQISVRVINSKTNEEILIQNRVFKLKKYDGMIYVDYPRSSNFSNDTNLTIEGWELSETSNSTIKVFLDNTEIAVNRYERQDVLNYYPNAYGGAVKNATPGFTTKLSLNNVTAGSHTISIKLYSSFGDLISEVKKVIYVYSNMYFGIDVSSHQGNIDWKSVAASVIDFVIIRL